MQITKGKISFEVNEQPEWFWPTVNDDTWEPHTFQIFDMYLKKDRTYLDIGSWIGPTVLYGAQLAKEVYAFEPDPVAYNALLKNLALNPSITNVVAKDFAIGGEAKMAELGRKTGFGDSMSSLMWPDDAIQVKQYDLALFGKQLDPNFIKIDIEGGELDLLTHPTTRAYLEEGKPTVCLSLHTPWFDNKDLYLNTIKDVFAHYPNVYNEKGEKVEDINALPTDAFITIVATYE